MTVDEVSGAGSGSQGLRGRGVRLLAGSLLAGTA